MNRRSIRRTRLFAIPALAVITALSTVFLGGVATADAPKPSAISSIVKDGQTWHMKVYSAAMAQDITIDVQRPVDESQPAPNFYLLNGLDGGLSDASWTAQTNALQFLAAKQVNVVQPIGGFASYYTDWDKPDPSIGVAKWRTFLTEELPPLLDDALHSTGVNALAGVSMSGTSVLQLAEAKPGLWKSVAAYSGCAQIADPMGQQFVKLVVQRGRGNTENMYGPDNSPEWAANDPVINAEKLRGTSLFVSSGSGIPVPDDVKYYLTMDQDPVSNAESLALGILIEGAVNQCTHNLKAKLDSIDIPATYDFTPVGTHYWPYWNDALHVSWPQLAQGMGIQP
ncbi:alpha/beta hydrolase [Nocardia sp. NBC_00511]|uniref:alpha/beta hydrolase n=1 Tax=Nocardia sp. NBC_00511 TaxID=2903591 RepID=UPI0030DF5739